MPLDFRRRVRAQAPILLVVGIVIAAVLYMSVEPGHWRRGAGVIGLAMLLAGGLRLLLPAAHVGLLAIRGRYWDTTYYAVLGLLVLGVDLRLMN